MKLTENEIIDYYVNNKTTISKMSKIFDNTYDEINKTLKYNNIQINGGRKRITIDLEDLKDKYCIQSMSIRQLSEYFKLDKDTIRDFIKINKLERPNLNIVNKRIKSDYFSKIDSSKKAYWIGLLFADGCVDNIKGFRIRLELQESDLYIIEELKSDLCLDCRITKCVKNDKITYCISFTDKQIFEDLNKFGIVPNKTYATKHLKYNDIPQEYMKDYLRGIFDGDGCVTYDKNDITDVSLSYTTYHESVINEIELLVDNLINKTTHNKCFHTNAWHLSVERKKASSFNFR